MDRDRRSLIRLRRGHQAVLCAESDPNTIVYVHESDTGAVLRHPLSRFLIVLQQIFTHLRWHTIAVVAHGDIDVADRHRLNHLSVCTAAGIGLCRLRPPVLPAVRCPHGLRLRVLCNDSWSCCTLFGFPIRDQPATDTDLGIVIRIHVPDAVIDGILEDRLDDELDAEVVPDVLIDVKHHGEIILIAHLLDVHIVFRMLQLLRKRNDVLSTAQADTEEARELRHHEDRFLVVLALDHPDDGIQGVVEEVRIDLRLERIHLRLSLLLLLDDDVLHQLIDPGHRTAKGPAEMLYLLGAAHIDILRHDIAALHPLDGAVQPVQRQGNLTRHDLIHEDHDEEGDRHEQDHDETKAARIHAVGTGRDHGDHLPAGVGNRVQQHLATSTEVKLLMMAILVVRLVDVVLCENPVVDLHLLRMIDEAAARVGQIDVLTARILIDPLHHAVDGGVVHIDEENTHGRGSVFIDFDCATQRDDPAIAIGRIQKEIFDMWGGEMQIIGLSKRLGKPALGRHIEIFLRRGDRRG